MSGNSGRLINPTNSKMDSSTNFPNNTHNKFSRDDSDFDYFMSSWNPFEADSSTEDMSDSFEVFKRIGSHRSNSLDEFSLRYFRENEYHTKSDQQKTYPPYIDKTTSPNQSPMNSWINKTDKYKIEKFKQDFNENTNDVYGSTNSKACGKTMQKRFRRVSMGNSFSPLNIGASSTNERKESSTKNIVLNDISTSSSLPTNSGSSRRASSSSANNRRKSSYKTKSNELKESSIKKAVLNDTNHSSSLHTLSTKTTNSKILSTLNRRVSPSKSNNRKESVTDKMVLHDMITSSLINSVPTKFEPSGTHGSCSRRASSFSPKNRRFSSSKSNSSGGKSIEKLGCNELILSAPLRSSPDRISRSSQRLRIRPDPPGQFKGGSALI